MLHCDLYAILATAGTARRFVNRATPLSMKIRQGPAPERTAVANIGSRIAEGDARAQPRPRLSWSK